MLLCIWCMYLHSNCMTWYHHPPTYFVRHFSPKKFILYCKKRPQDSPNICIVHVQKDIPFVAFVNSFCGFFLVVNEILGITWQFSVCTYFLAYFWRHHYERISMRFFDERRKYSHKWMDPERTTYKAITRHEFHYVLDKNRMLLFFREKSFDLLRSMKASHVFVKIV